MVTVPQFSFVTATSVVEDIEAKETDHVRRTVTDHMVMPKHTSSRVTTLTEVDMTKLVRWREKNKKASSRREGVEPIYMPAITETTAEALAAYL